jgi:glycosyltransferase involved in cell wall biosynthesis
MYSGNMGQAHDLATLIEAARRLRERRDLRFLFIGEGVKRHLVEAAARELPNISLAPYQFRTLLSQSLSAGDVHLVSLSAGLAGLSEPSKLYGIMAAGRPTVFVGPAESEAACTIRRERAGFAISAGDVSGLVTSLLELAQNPELRREMGSAAREALVARHERRIATGKFAAVVERLQRRPKIQSSSVKTRLSTTDVASGK